MPRHDYPYQSQTITVFLKQAGKAWSPWRVVISSAHVPWPIGKYELRTFSTELKAAAYGRKAAESFLDQPPARSRRKKTSPH